MKTIIEEYEEHIYDGVKFPRYKEVAFKIWRNLHSRKYVGFNDCDEDLRIDALEDFVRISKDNEE
jgi:hypothetical protein